MPREERIEAILTAWYERQRVILPNDHELVCQLTSRRGWPDSKGRLALESKQDMRARGLSSPDRADAVLALCGLPPLSMSEILAGFHFQRQREFESDRLTPADF